MFRSPRLEALFGKHLDQLTYDDVKGVLNNGILLVDDLADAGPALVAAGSLLVDQLFHAFNIPEVPLLTAEGQLNVDMFGQLKSDLLHWMQQTGFVQGEDA